MAVTVKLRYLRISPRKVRLLADLVRGKSVEKAQAILNFTIKKSGQPMLKLLNSAVAAAKNNFHLDPANLYISKITVDEGPKHKRWRPRARGQAYPIQKKTSHITIGLDETKDSPQKSKKLKRAEKNKKTKEPYSVKRPRIEKPKLRPRGEGRIGVQKPKTEKGLQRIFRRKAF